VNSYLSPPDENESTDIKPSRKKCKKKKIPQSQLSERGRIEENLCLN
tara:strand:+ start:1172 stop:1312 length:141 start_codon:yes stop_codon:yes gene_type:complete